MLNFFKSVHGGWSVDLICTQLSTAGFRRTMIEVCLRCKCTWVSKPAIKSKGNLFDWIIYQTSGWSVLVFIQQLESRPSGVGLTMGRLRLPDISYELLVFFSIFGENEALDIAVWHSCCCKPMTLAIWGLLCRPKHLLTPQGQIH